MVIIQSNILVLKVSKNKARGSFFLVKEKGGCLKEMTRLAYL